MFSNEEARNEGLADRWLIWRREAIYGCLAGVDLCRPYGATESTTGHDNCSLRSECGRCSTTSLTRICIHSHKVGANHELLLHLEVAFYHVASLPG